MEENAIYEILRPIIVERLEVEPEEVQLSTAFTDLGADSLDIIEVAMELESAFHVVIPDRDYAGLTTIADAVRYIAARTASPAV